METPQEPHELEEYTPIPDARPEVEGPNPMPTGSRFDTSTENYAAGATPTPTITESAKRARAKLQGLEDSEPVETPAAIRARVAQEARQRMSGLFSSTESTENKHVWSPDAQAVINRFPEVLQRQREQDARAERSILRRGTNVRLFPKANIITRKRK